MSRHVWNIAEVADTAGPAALYRSYLEQRDVRRCLAEASRLRPIRRAADVGCGFGRLTPVLTEFADEVVAFEREATFVEQARRLHPSVTFHHVPTLKALPRETGTIDFAMTFTVLQHMRDEEARAVLDEVKRVARDGLVLLCEETDPSLETGLTADDVGVTIGRSESVWVDWMQPFELHLRFPRVIEPGYPRENVGSYMLFRGSRA